MKRKRRIREPMIGREPVIERRTKGISPGRAFVFVFVLFIIARSINGVQEHKLQVSAQQARQQQIDFENQMAAQKAALEKQRLQAEQEAAARKAAADARVAHAQYLARYLEGGAVRKSGVETIAIVTASEDGKVNHALNDALARRFKAATVETLPSFFKPEFISDDLFAKAFGGSTEVFKNLELANSVDVVLLARQEVNYSTNPSLQNVITASMALNIVMLPVANSAQNQTWTFTAAGAGFKREDARALAEERIIKQINDDTKMSFSKNP